MANPTFYYPTVAGATSTLEFERGEFKNDIAFTESNQVTETSMYGEIMTQSKGSNLKKIPLTVQVPIATQAGNIADTTKLDTFLKTTVNFTVRPFYFTNASGTTYKVKLLNKSLEPSAVYVNYLEYKFVMKEVE